MQNLKSFQAEIMSEVPFKFNACMLFLVELFALLSSAILEKTELIKMNAFNRVIRQSFSFLN